MHRWLSVRAPLRWRRRQTVSFPSYLIIYDADNIGIFTFLVVEITPVSIAEVGYRTYIYFASASHLFMPFGFLLLIMYSLQFLLSPDRLFLLSRAAQPHPGTGRPAIHRPESTVALGCIDGPSRRCRGKNGEGRGGPARGIVYYLLYCIIVLLKDYVLRM